MEICDTGPTRGQKVAKNKKTHISAISNLKCMYTNCDTLTNKTSELKLAIDSNHPDIIVLTEVTPKNNRYILQKSEIEIKGYNLYCRALTKRSISQNFQNVFFCIIHISLTFSILCQKILAENRLQSSFLGFIKTLYPIFRVCFDNQNTLSNVRVYNTSNLADNLYF